MSEYAVVFIFIIAAVLGTDVVIHLFHNNLQGLIDAKFRYYRLMAYVILSILCVFVLMELLSHYTTIV